MSFLWSCVRQHELDMKAEPYIYTYVWLYMYSIELPFWTTSDWQKGITGQFKEESSMSDVTLVSRSPNSDRLSEQLKRLAGCGKGYSPHLRVAKVTADIHDTASLETDSCYQTGGSTEPIGWAEPTFEDLSNSFFTIVGFVVQTSQAPDFKA